MSFASVGEPDDTVPDLPSSEPAAPAVTVIVPIYNGGRRLPLLLDALEAQTAPSSSTRCSSSTTAPWTRPRRPSRPSGFPRLLRTPRRGGSYAARNIALREARGRLLAFTDGDCLPDPEWIANGLKTFEAQDVDLVAGHIHVPVPERPTISAMLDASRFLDQARYARENFGATANLWVRAEVFDRAGTFNDRLISGGDTEWCNRAVAAGARLVYGPEVAVTHEARSKPTDLWRKSYRLGFGAAQHKYHAEGPLRDRDRVWLHPGAYLPRGELVGLDRLHAQGINPSRGDRIAMFWTQYFFVKLPNAFGNFAGHVKEVRIRRSSAQST